MTVYDKSRNKVVVIDAREQAPRLAYTEMFNSNPEKASTGGLAVSVPGQVKGLYTAKKLFGNPKVYKP